MSTSSTKHVRIRGRVQGVGYRDWAATSAMRRGLTGWVRNLTDGSVEAVVHGPPAMVLDFVAACQKGPPLARVTSVDAEDASAFDGQGFEQRATAPPP